jgi:hypothetical protein
MSIAHLDYRSLHCPTFTNIPLNNAIKLLVKLLDIENVVCVFAASLKAQFNVHIQRIWL